MKRYSNLYNKIDLRYINYIYNSQIRVNTKNKVKIRKFEDFYSLNVSRAMECFDRKNYFPSKYNVFLVKEPKYRVIMSQNIFDKLINHVIANILIDVLVPTLIDTNVATIRFKGTHYGIKCLKRYLNELKQGEIYALKFDISKYFYNIDHNILKEIVCKKIKDKDFLKILFDIIDSTNYGVNNKINIIKKNEINKIKKMHLKNESAKINEIENLPIYKYGKGLPIGNMTSQILAVYYLNELDHFIKEKLKIKHYIRYMDDGVLLSYDKEYLKYCLKEITKITDKYKLKLNNKTKIINITKGGIDFLGFRFYIINNKVILKVRNSCKKKLKKKMKMIRKGKYSSKKALQIVNSYKGHLKWGNCFNLIKTNGLNKIHK